MKSQKKLILAALQRGDTLTPMDALERFGCFRLGARVYDLRQEGHPIISEMVRTRSGKRVARYRMDGKLRLL